MVARTTSPQRREISGTQMRCPALRGTSTGAGSEGQMPRLNTPCCHILQQCWRRGLVSDQLGGFSPGISTAVGAPGVHHRHRPRTRDNPGGPDPSASLQEGWVFSPVIDFLGKPKPVFSSKLCSFRCEIRYVCLAVIGSRNRTVARRLLKIIKSPWESASDRKSRNHSGYKNIILLRWQSLNAAPTRAKTTAKRNDGIPVAQRLDPAGNALEEPLENLGGAS